MATATAAPKTKYLATRVRSYTVSGPLEREVGDRAYTVSAVFETLSDKLGAALGDLRGRGRLDEEAISRAMREIRLALLEADVNFRVVKDFVARVRERAVGQDVLKSLSPGQQVVKIVHEELTELMGSGDSRLAFAGRPPTVVLLAGLQGSGKTTAAAKLALLLRREGKKPALVAADLQRPAAIDQLEQLGKQIQIPVYREATDDPVRVVERGLASATAEGRDVVIVDTAGRLHVEEALMDELVRVRDAAKPTNVLLVLDAMTGQEAVAVAEAFQERVAFDGVVLTKLDGDARGGAALSVKAVTGRPIKLISLGEKLDQLEYFHPDRMASRILGMGDVLTLIEKAEQAADEDEQARLEQQMLAGQFSFDDLLTSYRMLKKMGSVKSVLGMVPGLGKQLQGVDINEKDMARVEAIVLSMTPRERRMPHLIDLSRRRRIASGSGTTLEQVNQLMSARKQMQKMMKGIGKGRLPAIPAEAGMVNGPSPATLSHGPGKRKAKKRKARKR
jgi:signal recognition particle subunit SRP54